MPILTQEATTAQPQYDETGRSINPYATFGPAELDGVSWHEYFAAQKAPYAPLGDENAEEVVRTRVLVKSRQAGADDPVPNALWSLQKFLATNGWQTRVGYRQELEIGQTVKSGDRKGEVNPDKVVDYSWLVAIEGEGSERLRVGYRQPEGAASATCWYRLLNGNEVSAKELREYVSVQL